MKKTAVTLAIAAASGALHAQSSVTMFGVVDLAVSHYSTRSSWYNQSGLPLQPPGGMSDVRRSQTALSSGANSTSRLGFRGTEDLGGGMAASFWLESGFTADNGGSGSFSFDRRSTVSLSGPWGEVRLGRDYVPTYWNDTSFDPFGPVGVGTGVLSRVNQNIAIARGSGSTLSSADNAIRSSNSVGYFLPSGLGGFYGQLMHAFHENVESSNVAGSPDPRGRYVGGRFGYASGPLDVAISYGESTGEDYPDLVANKIKIANLGASYDFKFLKLSGALARTTAVTKPALVSTGSGSFLSANDETYTGALVGVSVPVGAGVVKAAYSRMKSESDPTIPVWPAAAHTDASANKFSIGYVHNLSKRTALYATAARVRISNGQNNPAILGLTTGGGPTYLSTGGGVAGFAPRSATGYDFGLRHTF